jgi:hypothetical protein
LVPVVVLVLVAVPFEQSLAVHVVKVTGFARDLVLSHVIKDEFPELLQVIVVLVAVARHVRMSALATTAVLASA